MKIYDNVRKKYLDSTEIVENIDESRYEVVIEHGDDMFKEAFKEASKLVKRKKYVLTNTIGLNFNSRRSMTEIVGVFDTHSLAKAVMNDIYERNVKTYEFQISLERASGKETRGHCSIDENSAYIDYSGLRYFGLEINTIYLD